MATLFVPGSPIHIRKLRPDGSEKLAWDGVVLHAERSGVIVRAEFTLPRVELGCATFLRGDVFVELYRWRRPYTVAQVSAADGALKGWYCDVCMPPRRSAPGELLYVDFGAVVRRWQARELRRWPRLLIKGQDNILYLKRCGEQGKRAEPEAAAEGRNNGGNSLEIRG